MNVQHRMEADKEQKKETGCLENANFRNKSLVLRKQRICEHGADRIGYRPINQADEKKGINSQNIPKRLESHFTLKLVSDS